MCVAGDSGGLPEGGHRRFEPLAKAGARRALQTPPDPWGAGPGSPELARDCAARLWAAGLQGMPLPRSPKLSTAAHAGARAGSWRPASSAGHVRRSHSLHGGIEGPIALRASRAYRGYRPVLPVAATVEMLYNIWAVSALLGLLCQWQYGLGRSWL